MAELLTNCVTLSIVFWQREKEENNKEMLIKWLSALFLFAQLHREQTLDGLKMYVYSAQYTNMIRKQFCKQCRHSTTNREIDRLTWRENNTVEAHMYLGNFQILSVT